MSSQSLLGEEKSHINALLAKKARLLLEISETEDELRRAQARHGRLQNSLAAVSKLPDELFTDIFLICQRNASSKDPLFEVVASHVSTRWRQIALGTPLLWNDIYLFVIPSRPQTLKLDRLSAYLTRSSPCLLRIYLSLPTSDRAPPFLSLMTPHASRWHQVSISALHGSGVDLYDSLCSLSAPSLVHLSLRIETGEDFDSPRTEYPASCLPILVSGSPALSLVRVAGTVVGRIAPHYATVSTLHIDAWPTNIMSYAQFQGMLETLPALVNLSLTGLSVRLPRDPLVVLSPTVMPSLRSLRIRGNATPCHRLLTFMEMPQLESLSLHAVQSFDSRPIPTLRSLVLETCILSDDELVNIIRAFPSVTSLGIDDSVPKIYLMLEPVSDQGEQNWPALEVVYQRELRPADVAPFCLLMFGRARTDMSLKRLFLDRRSRTVLKSRGHHLAVLVKLLEVERSDDLAAWPVDLGDGDRDDVWLYD